MPHIFSSHLLDILWWFQRSNCQHLLDHRKSKKFQKNIYFFCTEYTKAFDCVNLKNCGIFFKRWEHQTTLPASCETCIQIKTQQLESDIKQQTGSKLEKECVKAVYCHPAYLTCMQSTLCEMLGWMKHKLESRLPGEISITLDRQMIPPLWQKVKRNSKASWWWKWKWRVKKLA